MVKVKSDAVKKKKKYCIGTWNVRSTSQVKSEAVKQEIARLKINILELLN